MVTPNFTVVEIPVDESNCTTNANTAMSYLLQHPDKIVSDCSSLI